SPSRPASFPTPPNGVEGTKTYNQTIHTLRRSTALPTRAWPCPTLPSAGVAQRMDRGEATRYRIGGSHRACGDAERGQRGLVERADRCRTDQRYGGGAQFREQRQRIGDL